MGVKMDRNSKIIVMSILSISSIFLFILIGLSIANSPISDAEKSFYSILKPLVKKLKKVDKIPAEKTIKDGEVYFSTKKATNYVYRNMKNWENFERELNKFILTYPQSRWKDDAAICLGIEYLVISLKEKPLTQKALTAYQNALDLPQIALEEKTKKYFKNMNISYIFSSPPYEEWIGELDEETRLRVIFARAKIIEYLKIGDFQGAKDEIAKIAEVKELNFKKNIDSLQEIVNSWEDKYKKHKFIPSKVQK
jgi:tetratricopeptide (TPR) repeat protein